ncbi:hypothetical protein ACHHYP_15033 [Achlya hypogyna]|uniref:Guanine nucleotide-binding protein subunit beta-like protein n=1 Tax=Achlya hypogyna TaxID=1202772 RepID=A0A1V9YBS9_ACHHY|nr:hypothetical protein ACHHYP_15033 [Achlya hypogyna]
MARPAPAPTAVLRGHVAAVNSVAFVTNGVLASGAADGTLKLWDLSVRRAYVTSAVHSKAGVLEVAALGDGLLTQGRDGFLSIWDVSSGAVQMRRKIPCGSYTFTKARPLGEHLILAPLEEATMMGVFDTRAEGAPVVRLNGTALKSGMCMALDAVPSDNTAEGDPCAGFEGGLVAKFELRAPSAPVTCAAGHTIDEDTVMCMATTSTGTLCGTSSKEIFCVDWRTLATRAVYQSRKDGFGAVASRGDHRIFASGGWDNVTCKRLATLTYHTDSVNSLTFSSDNVLLASGSKDHKIALWSLYPPSAS